MLWDTIVYLALPLVAVVGLLLAVFGVFKRS